MGFDIVDFLWRYADAGVGGPQYCHLGGWVWGHQTVRPAVLVDRGTANYGQHRILVAQRVAESLEYCHAAAFAAYKAVGSSIERVA